MTNPADHPPPSNGASAAPQSDSRFGRHRELDAITDLFKAVKRSAELKFRIAVVQAKITAVRFAIIGALLLASLILGVMGIIFLYITAFHLLTDIAHLAPVWAYLIFSGAHLVGVAICISVVTAMFRRRES